MTILERPIHTVEALLTDQDRLNIEAAFDLGDHQLVDPTTNRGTVSSIETCEPVSMAGNALPAGVQVFEIGIVDPFVDADPTGYAIVKNHITHLEGLIAARGFDPLEERRKEHPYMNEGEESQGAGNKFTQAWLNAPNLAALKAWHSNVPTAEALGYLTNPCVDCEILDKDGNSFTSSPETAAHLRFVDDGVAIRDRAVGMQEIAENHLRNFEAGQQVRWLSLASGTAEPAIAASKKASDELGIGVDLTVVDINKASLKYVEANAEQYGFEDSITTLQTNILHPEFPTRLAQKTGTDEKYDVVENMGFEEYLPQEGDELGAYLNMGLPQASEFTRNAYELVKPGGILISGNMVLDRPQRGFVFGVVDWPVINARSEESILNIYEKAGIPMDQVKLFRVRNEQTGAHVYDIVLVTKPLSEE